MSSVVQEYDETEPVAALSINNKKAPRKLNYTEEEYSDSFSNEVDSYLGDMTQQSVEEDTTTLSQSAGRSHLTPRIATMELNTPSDPSNIHREMYGEFYDEGDLNPSSTQLSAKSSEDNGEDSDIPEPIRSHPYSSYTTLAMTVPRSNNSAQSQFDSAEVDEVETEGGNSVLLYLTPPKSDASLHTGLTQTVHHLKLDLDNLYPHQSHEGTPSSRGMKRECPVSTVLDSANKRLFLAEINEENNQDSLPPATTAATEGVILSTEQQAIVSFDNDNALLRVTAGAGTGKTTTLIHRALSLLKRGYRQVVYLVYNKLSATHANDKFQSPFVDARTVHSQAFRCCKVSETNSKLLTDDDDLRRVIRSICQSGIEEFLSRMPDSTSKKTKQNTIQTIESYITKNFVQFLHKEWTMEDFKSSVSNDLYLYYPARLYHSNKGHKKEPLPTGVPSYFKEKSRILNFYYQMTMLVWTHLNIIENPEAKSTTFDMILKIAQLSRLQIPCSTLLVDETQDLNACQIAWILDQFKLYSTPICMVGDPAQSIYSFRGAKSLYLLKETNKLPSTVDLKLTTSYRFGPQIACIANRILLCKENSPQVETFLPYRLIGGGSSTSRVVSTSLLPPPPHQQVTLLAFANLELFEYVVENLMIEEHGVLTTRYRIAINCGSAEGNSGVNLWRGIKHKFNAFYRIFTGESDKLNYFPWNMHPDEKVTWDEVVYTVLNEEINKFQTIVSLIQTYGVQSHSMLNSFVSEVLDKRLDPADPSVDIILSTIHCAKGLEWDNVMVLDKTLFVLSQYQDSSRGFIKASVRAVLQGKWCMNWKDYGDDCNLWYVALTRARKVLSVPEKYMNLVTDIRRILTFQGMSEEQKHNVLDASLMMIGDEPRQASVVPILYRDIAKKWIEECGRDGRELVIDNIKLLWEPVLPTPIGCNHGDDDYHG